MAKAITPWGRYGLLVQLNAVTGGHASGLDLARKEIGMRLATLPAAAPCTGVMTVVSALTRIPN